MATRATSTSTGWRCGSTTRRHRPSIPMTIRTRPFSRRFTSIFGFPAVWAGRSCGRSRTMTPTARWSRHWRRAWAADHFPLRPGCHPPNRAASFLRISRGLNAREAGEEDNGLQDKFSPRSLRMGSVALLQSLKESILGQAGVKAIYGEPITAQGKTIIPVAKLIYGYGAGAGTGGVGNSSAQGEGGGGGAGVRAIPVGVIEISDQGTCFIPITSK